MLRTLRRAELTVLVDANQAQQGCTPQPDEGPTWTYERALQTARELERLAVFWLEEPLDRHRGDRDHQRVSARRLGIVEVLDAAGH